MLVVDHVFSGDHKASRHTAKIISNYGHRAHALTYNIGMMLSPVPIPSFLSVGSILSSLPLLLTSFCHPLSNLLFPLLPQPSRFGHTPPSPPPQLLPIFFNFSLKKVDIITISFSSIILTTEYKPKPLPKYDILN